MVDCTNGAQATFVPGWYGFEVGFLNSRQVIVRQFIMTQLVECVGRALRPGPRRPCHGRPWCAVGPFRCNLLW